MQQSMFSLEEHHANRFPSRDFGRAWLTLEETCASRILPFLSAIARHGASGKMCPESLPRGPAMTRQVIWQKDKNGKLKKQVISDASWLAWQNSGMGGPTGLSTLNTCEWTSSSGPFPTSGGVCSLSDIAMTGELPQRYYLSAKASRGILRRAAKRRKLARLPILLKAALEIVAGATGWTATV